MARVIDKEFAIGNTGGGQTAKTAWPRLGGEELALWGNSIGIHLTLQGKPWGVVELILRGGQTAQAPPGLVWGVNLMDPSPPVGTPGGNGYARHFSRKHENV